MSKTEFQESQIYFGLRNVHDMACTPSLSLLVHYREMLRDQKLQNSKHAKQEVNDTGLTGGEVQMRTTKLRSASPSQRDDVSITRTTQRVASRKSSSVKVSEQEDLCNQVTRGKFINVVCLWVS